MRDNIKKFEDKECVVLGVSMDDAASHKKFCDDQKLPFDLIVDTDGKIHKAFGFEKRVRATFLIDKKGTIAYANKAFKLDDATWGELYKAVEALSK